MLDRTQAPELKAVNKVVVHKAISEQLTNQVPIHIISSGTQPIVRLELVFDAGQYFELKKGNSFMMAKMLLEGTKNYIAKEIAEIIATFGAHLDVNTGNDKFTLTLTVLNKYLNNVLPIVKDIIANSIFPQKNFDNIKKINFEQIKVSLEKTAYVAAGLFRKQLFSAESPYGYFLDTELIESIELNDVVANFNQTIKDIKYEIIVSGLIGEDELLCINKHLGAHDIKLPGSLSKQSFNYATSPAKIRVEKADNLQCSIRIGKKLFTKKHPDYMRFLVLNETLGGYFGSRLMKNIREEKGLTYGINSQVVTLINEGYFVIGADVKKENVSLATSEIYKEINILRNQEINADELETVKNYIIGGFLGSVTTPFQLADKFKGIHYHGMDYSFYDNYIENIRKVTAKDLIRLANTYLDVESMSEVVVG
ncbi:MAG: pitrilysin family protein [Bacteroidota bacterium]|nr:pitrilysin family protein [Bacteroidota bacterium]